VTFLSHLIRDSVLQICKREMRGDDIQQSITNLSTKGLHDLRVEGLGFRLQESKEQCCCAILQCRSSDLNDRE
jgi:hypothetical protein